MTALHRAVAPASAAPPEGGSVATVPVFAEVYESYFAFAWRTARRLGTPEPHLDDVVQDAFLVVYRRLPSFEGRASLKTWIFRILVNVVRTHRRRWGSGEAQRSDAAADDVPAVVSEGPHESLSRSEASRFLNQWLETLDDEKRAVFVLAELEQVSAPEIAAALGIPLNTVYSRVRHARHEFEAAAARHRARDEWKMR